MRLTVDGKKLYHNHLKGSPLSEMRISFFAGARFDKDFPGLSHFVEHAMFCGTTGKNEEAINNEIQLLGGHVNASTGRETVTYFVEGISENFLQVADVLVDILNNPTFPYSKIKRERGAIEREIALRSTLEAINEDAINGHFFGGAFREPITGSVDSIKTIGRKHITKFIYNHYSVDTCAIGITGDVALKDAETIARKLNLSTNLMDRPITPFIPPKSSAKGYYKIGSVDDGDELILSMRWPCPQMGDEKNPAIDLLTQILSEGSSSRLDNKLRIKYGISYGTSMYTIKYTDRGCISLEGNFSRNDMERAIDIIMKEIAHLKKHKVSDDELTINRNKLLFDAKQSSMYPILQNQEETLAYLFNLSTPDQYSNRMMRVDKDELIETANEIFSSRPIIYVSN